LDNAAKKWRREHAYNIKRRGNCQARRR
jgi:hypothetical protein